MKTISNLWKKEWQLCLKPSVFIYIYALLSILLIAPNYPYCTAFLYAPIGIAVLFSIIKSNKDIEFTSILPIKRADIVKSKILSILFIELLQIAVAIPFALISALLINPAGNIVGLDANITLFGTVLIEFSIFNIIFIPLFFKTGYKVGFPTFCGFVGYIVTTIGLELLIALVPTLNTFLDGYLYLGYQIIVLLMGIAFFVISTIISYKIAVKNFEEVNL